MKISLSLYWKCQLIGWNLASLYWMALAVIEGNFYWGLGIAQFLTDVLLYITLTHAYRNFALKQQWNTLDLSSLLKRLLWVLPLMALLFALFTSLKVYGIRNLFFPDFPETYLEFVQKNATHMLMAGARLIAIWLLAYHLYHYAQREISLGAKNLKLESANLEVQLKQLSSQLNPHFLFNSINTIKSLVYTHPDSASRALDLLSDLLRNSLYQGKKTCITVAEELQLVDDYLELQKLRFEDSLQISKELDSSLLDLELPRMSLQTLVENAVKHGITNAPEGGTITIHSSQKGGMAVFEIGSPKNSSHDDLEQLGIGLENLQRRLALHYAGKGSFELIYRDHNVCALLKIPIS